MPFFMRFVSNPFPIVFPSGKGKRSNNDRINDDATTTPQCLQALISGLPIACVFLKSLDRFLPVKPESVIRVYARLVFVSSRLAASLSKA